MATEKTIENKGFDLTSLDTRSACEQGAELELLHPVSREKLGASIRLLGADSEQYRRIVSRKADARLEQLRRGKITKIEDQENDNIELLSGITLSWSGLQEEGKDLSFSKENAVRIYRQYPWITEQVAAFVGERANFLPA